MPLKRRSVREETILCCPVCGSINIERIRVLGVTPTLYLCKNCGYKGYIVLELDINNFKRETNA